MNKKSFFLIIFIVVFLIVQLIYWMNPIDINTIIAGHNQLIEIIKRYPIISAITYIAIFIITNVFGLPLSVTIIGGFLFGIIKGIAFSMIAALCSAILICAGTRYLVKDWIYKKFKNRLEFYTNKIEKYGLFYIFLFQVTPFTPTLLIYAATALTSLRLYKIITMNIIGSFLPICFYTIAGSFLHTVGSFNQLIWYLGIFGIIYGIGLMSIFLLRYFFTSRYNR